MVTQHRSLAAFIADIARADETVVYRVKLVSGETLEGWLRHHEGSDYVRVVAVPANSGVNDYFVALAQIVYVQKRAQQ
jgi:hypothetical protein